MDLGRGQEFSRRVGAFAATVAMFAYVVGGMWFGRFFILLGILVTALTVVGFFAVPGWFPLWMAFVGGGALVLSGVYLKSFRRVS